MTIPTIRRRKWHGSYRWQATDADGTVVAYRLKPKPDQCEWEGVHGWCVHDEHCLGFILGPKTAPPRDYTKTLRRIGGGM